MIEKNEKYLELMRQLIPINELPASIQDEFINKVELVLVAEGDTLFRKGQEDNYSYYLLEGEIELQGDLENSTITAGTKGSRYAMAQLQPRQFNALALIDSVVVQILRSQVDNLIVLYEKDQADSYGREPELDVSGVEVGDDDDGEDTDWMIKMLQSELFSRLPTANIHTLFALLEPLELKTGDVVIRQGEPGEYYYIIQEGRCQVSRKPRADSKDINLAVMGPGDSFGEESLFTDTNRNATVTMLTDGIIMQLSKDDFFELIKKPALQEISYEDALCLVEIGNGEWIDVRFKNEYEEAAIKDSRNIPLNMLRMQAAKLPQDRQYIVYCDTGGRSLSAAFLLTGLGFNVSYLGGGLVGNPHALQSVEEPQPQPEAEAPAAAPEKEPQPAVPAQQTQQAAEDMSQQSVDDIFEAAQAEAAAPSAKPAVKSKSSVAKPETIRQAQPDLTDEGQTDDDEGIDLDLDDMQVTIEDGYDDDDLLYEELDPDVKASMLETQLAKANLKLMDTSRIVHIAETKGMRRAREELEDRLHKERIRIEVAKEAAELEARKLRELEESRIERKRKEAARVLQREKRKIDKIYAQKAEEMEKIQMMKQENEELLQANRVKLEQATQEAVEKMAEAREQFEFAKKLKAEVEKSRLELLRAETEQQKKQQQQELKLQEEVKAKLAAERRFMAEKIAGHQQELETYKAQKAAAEAAREAAKKEAQRIIAEQKAKHERDKEQIQQQLRKERLQLETEQLKIQKALLDIRQMKQDAETAKQKALDEAATLRKRQQQLEQNMNREIQERVRAELQKAQEKIKRAKKEIVQAEQAQLRVVAAKKENEKNILKQKEHEEKILKVTAIDSAAEQERKEKLRAQIFSHQEKLKRIQNRAAAAKQSVQPAGKKNVLELEQRLEVNKK